MPRLAACCLLLCLPGSLCAEPPEAAKAEFFERRVRPLLIDECQDCHSGEAPESGLDLSSLAGMLRGGIRGPAIVPGDAEGSLLIRAVRHGELVKMPPKRKLAPAAIDTLARWIADGAVWPGAEPPEAAAPAANASATPAIDQQQREFWSFQPVVRPPLPEVRETAWVRSPVDHFILRQLEARQLAPGAPADRRALIRRVTYDLTGLPPAPQAVREFLADRSPTAYQRLVDRLLASPRYGERWGRHWLDVARYADSNGLDENLCYGNAFRYRDYVIAAFNADKPYRRFVQEQVAGDLLPASGRWQRHEGVVATGFLCVGPKMLAEDDPVKMRMDIVDEQIDTLSRAFMGLTLGCARCHDHKFDPIPAADYYALAGIFHSTHTMDTHTVVAKWHERPLETAELQEQRERHQRQLAELDEQIARTTKAAAESLRRVAIAQTGDYLLAAELSNRRSPSLDHLEPLGPQDNLPAGCMLIEAEAYDRGNVNRDTTNYGVGIGVLVNRGETPNFVEYDVACETAGAYRLELRLAAAASRPCKLAVNGVESAEPVAAAVTGSWLPDTQRWHVETVVQLRAGDNVLRLEHPQYFPHIDKLLLAPIELPDSKLDLSPLSEFDPHPPFLAQWRQQLADAAAPSSATLRRWRELSEADDAAGLRQLAADIQQRIAAGASGWDEPLEQLLRSDDGPLRTTVETLPEPARTKITALTKRRDEVKKQMPQPPQAMAVQEGTPGNLRIHLRGSHLTLGVEAPRGFLRVLSPEDQRPSLPEDGSGRLELAHWLTRPEHPLTARVYVNRLWTWHFGDGLVRSPDNFGALGERPTHPELLDWLADELVRSGWSTKHIQRMILTSATYRQSVSGSDRLRAEDPENRLWGRMPRRRLEAEAIRDSLLAVSGTLDTRMGGSTLNVANRAYVTSTANVSPDVYRTNRRSVYLPVVRSELYEVLQAFDFAEPSVISGRRQSTTSAPQALFMMNSEAVSAATASLAKRLLEEQAEDGRRVEQAFWRILARPPTDEQRRSMLDFVEAYARRWAAEQPQRADEARWRSWQAVCRILVSSNEFMFRD